jgi:hypothetical protein
VAAAGTQEGEAEEGEVLGSVELSEDEEAVDYEVTPPLSPAADPESWPSSPAVAATAVPSALPRSQRAGPGTFSVVTLSDEDFGDEGLADAITVMLLLPAFRLHSSLSAKL